MDGRDCTGSMMPLSLRAMSMHWTGRSFILANGRHDYVMMLGTAFGTGVPHITPLSCTSLSTLMSPYQALSLQSVILHWHNQQSAHSFCTQ